MKKLIVLCLAAVLLLFCACGQGSPVPGSVPAQTESTTADIETSSRETAATVASDNEVAQPVINGIWLTSYEIAPESFSWTAAQYTRKIADICSELTCAGITDMFVQVRPNCDAFYDSSLFPSSDRFTGEQGKPAQYDALKIIIDQAHSSGLRVHAWINPYRVAADTQDITSLSGNNPARIWYEQGGNTNVVMTAGGIYLNPTSQQAQQLVLDGVREILDGYSVDGIHIDDYFYPSEDENIDSAEYSRYVAAGGTLSLGDFRRQAVSSLVSGLYNAVKASSPMRVFSVSPAGDIEANYSEYYADVALWCREDGYADYLVPQIYYGFENEKNPFEDCLDKWLSICNGQKLVVGLALYKCGQEDSYAGSGSLEWKQNDDVIERQTALSVLKASGFCLFSYSFFDNLS